VGSRRPASIVNHASSASGEVRASDTRCLSVEARCHKFIKRFVEVVLGGGVLISLDIMGPVENGAEPLSGIVLADGLRVRAKVDVLELVKLGEHILLEVSVVVRASCLDRTTSPPAAARVLTGAALHWTRSPACKRFGSHFHLHVNFASPRPIIKTSIEDSIRALSARCGRPAAVVILVTG